VRQVDQFGDTGLYVMPTRRDVFEKFSDERIEPAIEESPYLLSRIRGKWVRNKKLKRIGRGFLHLRGSNSKAGAQTVAAQFLFLDERDLLDQTNVPHIMRRVSGAMQIGKTPKVRHAGYPLIPNDGIDLLWQQSDQRVWHVTCKPLRRRAAGHVGGERAVDDAAHGPDACGRATTSSRIGRSSATCGASAGAARRRSKTPPGGRRTVRCARAGGSRSGRARR
jgi:hypothetical protein